MTNNILCNMLFLWIRNITPYNTTSFLRLTQQIKLQKKNQWSCLYCTPGRPNTLLHYQFLCLLHSFTALNIFWTIFCALYFAAVYQVLIAVRSEELVHCTMEAITQEVPSRILCAKYKWQLFSKQTAFYQIFQMSTCT